MTKCKQCNLREALFGQGNDATCEICLAWIAYEETISMLPDDDADVVLTDFLGVVPPATDLETKKKFYYCFVRACQLSKISKDNPVMDMEIFVKLCNKYDVLKYADIMINQPALVERNGKTDITKWLDGEPVDESIPFFVELEDDDNGN